MSKLLVTDDTVKKLGITGIGIDDIGYKLYLYHQLEPKIVGHKVPVSGSHSGIYYVESDVSNFMNGYTYFWINGRINSDDNIFQIDSATYDSINLRTIITVTEDANYKANYKDVGFQICGRIDITNIVQSLGSIEHQLFEDGSLSNGVASALDFVINDEDKSFYNRTNKSGYLYQKDVITEVSSIQSSSDYAPIHNIHSTYIKVKGLSRYYSGSDFVNGYIEFINGKASGSRAVITLSNGFNLKVLGFYAPNSLDTKKYHLNVAVGDEVRVFKSDTFWCRLDLWLRTDIDEKIAVFCGKIDNDEIGINDKERTINLIAYSTMKDMFNKDIANSEFDGGTNLSRMTEMKTLLVDNPAIRTTKVLTKSELSDNPLRSVKVKQVAYDVAEGWHLLDYHPFGNLFRFDLGRWHQIIDEGSFEKTTKQVFIASDDDQLLFNHYAKLPAHDGIFFGEILDRDLTLPPGLPSDNDTYIVAAGATGAWSGLDNMLVRYKTAGSVWLRFRPIFGTRVYITDEADDAMWDGSQWTTNVDNVNNLLLERNWHGKWCSIEIATEEAANVGVSNGNLNANANNYWKKLSGLPKYPFRMLFYVDGNREIINELSYVYSYDNGSLTIPKYIFDHIQEYNETDDVVNRDLTYALGFGCKYDMVSNASVPGYLSGKRISWRCYSFEKFNGVMITYRQEGVEGGSPPNTYGHYLNNYLTGLQVRFSNGNGFNKSINLLYSGGNVINRTSDSVFRLRIDDLNDSWDDNYTSIAGMKIIGLNGANFLVERIIDTVAQNGVSLIDLDLTLKSAFPNAVTLGDIFIIVNKNFNLKFHDLGHSFKNNIAPDVSAVEIRETAAGVYRDWKYQDWDDKLFTTYYPNPLDRIYIGHREKFNSIMVNLNYKSTTTDDYKNMNWYLKRGNFLIEYYDGVEWRSAKNVNIIPTTASPIRDNQSFSRDRDDGIRFLINFDADDWHTGGYDYTGWSSAATTIEPSGIDENKIYMMRMTLFTEISPLLLKIELSRLDDLNLCVMWDGIENWTPNLVEIEDGKVIVDTLRIEDVGLPMFGVQLYDTNTDATKKARQIRPINKFDGSHEDNLFAVIDFNNIKHDINNDLILSDPDKDTGISHFPKNVNFLTLMKKTLDASGFKNTKDVKSDMESYNLIDKNHINMIGTGYDGVYPVEAGWDAALTNENLSDYFDQPDSETFQDICAMKDNGTYRIWAVTDDKQEIHLYTSSDMKTWTSSGNIISNLGTNRILAINVVKNDRDSDYVFIITHRTTGAYFISYLITSNHAALDMSAITTLMTHANNLGKCDFLQLEGLANTSSANARIAAVVRYNNASLDGSLNPTGTPSVVLFYQHDAAWNGSWTEITSKSTYKNPVWVKANYSLTGSHTYANNEAINKFLCVCQSNSDNKLYRLGIQFNNDMTQNWYSPVLIKNTALTTISGFFVVRSTQEYFLLDSSSLSAFNLTSTNPDVDLFVGVDSSGYFKGFAMNLTITDWNLNQFWRSKLIENNELDWWRADNSSILLDQTDLEFGKHHRIYLGFRKQFNKVDCYPVTKTHIDKLRVRYWNGVTWSTFDKVYQFNTHTTDGSFHAEAGFSFDIPTNWVADKFDNTQSAYGADPLDQNTQSLYWIEIMSKDDIEIYMKRFLNCYTCLFMTDGRNLFYMDNWDYVRNIYSYPFEMDKKVKIDSLCYDREEKLVLVNLAEENPYEYKFIETLVFDYFGNFKYSYPVWSSDENVGVNQHITMKDKPDSIYRKGYGHIITAGADAFKAMLIGGWKEEFMEEIYDNGTHTPAGENCVGFSIPIPFEQRIRKYTLRGRNWLLSGSFWEDTVLNNIILGRRSELLASLPADVETEATWRSLIASITNNMLVHEELLNSPYPSLTAGYYAAIERSYLDWSYTYDWSIINEIAIGSLPGSGTNVWDAYVITDGQYKDFVVWWDGLIWNYKTPYAGLTYHNTTTGNYYLYDGKTWIQLPVINVFPGRTDSVDTTDFGIGLEWMLGNTAVKIPYFRPYNTRPDEWFNNNIFREFDQKVIHNYRHLNLGIDYKGVFGHDFHYTPATMPFGFNLKPTCAVEMPDLSAIKNEVGPTDDQEIKECNAPALAFGCYEFKDVSYADGVIPIRYGSAGTPMANMGICIHKPYGKVRNWSQAWYGTSFVDVTAEMNYRDVTNSSLVDTTNYLYLGSDTKNFALTVHKHDPTVINLKVQYLNNSGVWTDLNTEMFQQGILNTSDYVDNDRWGWKTQGFMFSWNPFINDWVHKTVNGVTKYWIRLSTVAGNNTVTWASMSGSVLFDSMKWYGDYNSILTSDKTPAYSPTDYDFWSFFDTYVPICLEYDPDNKRITGCFWNYDINVNEYYPFVIQFDRSQIKNITYNPWSFDVEYIKIIDDNGRDYSKKIQSIAKISVMDTKALLVDPNKPDGTAKIATIKNFTSGDSLFVQGVA